MIIGNGLIAKSLSKYKDNDNILIFASGVSDSKETRQEEFNREIKLIEECITNHKDKIFVYFGSTSSLLKNKNNYSIHKTNIENKIKNNFKKYIILRLPQVFGNGGNNNNLINFLKKNIIENKEILIYKNCYRSIIDVDDVALITDILIKNYKSKKILNISNIELSKVDSIINYLECILGKKSIIKYINYKSLIYKKNSKLIEKIIEENNIRKENYLLGVLKKYVKYN